jgi:hypothetical protein
LVDSYELLLAGSLAVSLALRLLWTAGKGHLLLRLAIVAGSDR